MRAPGRSRRTMRGQAMAEMVIAAMFFLVPLFLIIALLGKYIDLNASVLQAARYAAFQRTVFAGSNTLQGASVATRTDAQIQSATAMRFFSGGVNAITDAQNQSTGGFATLPLWTDQSLKPLVSASGIAAGTSAAQSPDLPDQALSVALGTLNTFGTGFDLPFNNDYTATVAVTPAHPVGPAPFDALNLTFTGHDALLADGWSARDPANVKYQVNRVLPTSIFDSVNSVLQILSFVLPDLSGLDLGHVLINDPNEVPADRLSASAGGGGGSSSSGAQQAAVSQISSQMTAQGYTLQSQTTQANGTITLVFANASGSTVTEYVDSNGGITSGGSTSTQTINESPGKATTDYVTSLATSGWTVSSGPNYTYDTSHNITGSTTTLTNSSGQTMTMTVTGSGGSASAPSTITLVTT